MKVIVSDTTSLIVLEGLQALDLLCAVFETILIPQAVLNELCVGSPDITRKINAAGCIEIIRLEPSEQLASLHLVLDSGEAEAITLALERQLPILIDERKGRSIALQKHLIVTGFAGLLLLAVSRVRGFRRMGVRKKHGLSWRVRTEDRIVNGVIAPAR